MCTTGHWSVVFDSVSCTDQVRRRLKMQVCRYPSTTPAEWLRRRSAVSTPVNPCSLKLADVRWCPRSLNLDGACIEYRVSTTRYSSRENASMHLDFPLSWLWCEISKWPCNLFYTLSQKPLSIISCPPSGFFRGNGHNFIKSWNPPEWHQKLDRIAFTKSDGLGSSATKFRFTLSEGLQCWLCLIQFYLACLWLKRYGVLVQDVAQTYTWEVQIQFSWRETEPEHAWGGTSLKQIQMLLHQSRVPRNSFFSNDVGSFRSWHSLIAAYCRYLA